MNVDNLGRNTPHVDLSKQPEFLLFAASVLIAALIIMMAAIKPDGVPLNSYKLGEKEFTFYVVGMLCIYLVLLFYCLYCTYRIFVRKKKNIRDQHTIFIKWKNLDNYWMYLLASFALVACLSLFCFYITSDENALTIGILMPLALIFFLNAILHYIMNDYCILQNITKLNEKIKKHN